MKTEFDHDSEVFHLDESFVPGATFTDTDEANIQQSAYESRVRAVMRKALRRQLNIAVYTLTTKRDWEVAYESYTEEFFMSLPLDFASMITFASVLIAQAQKSKNDIPDVWRRMAQGDFNFEEQLTNERRLNFD